ncbi:hypothetical protein [Mesorhizobium sp. WSM4906]|uniref:hypothetical protein n=1 Tax=Mesorhizobium sp. WSM4906 TaxID=3038546 RepID=UPI002416B700|nr:hypothetical protein [Mesorhizobium sp. WSM4906]WFP74476.1 hypothetical protein QAZ22_22390 [Mesorhizobium sp. WSM4906]
MMRAKRGWRWGAAWAVFGAALASVASVAGNLKNISEIVEKFDFWSPSKPSKIELRDFEITESTFDLSANKDDHATNAGTAVSFTMRAVVTKIGSTPARNCRAEFGEPNSFSQLSVSSAEFSIDMSDGSAKLFSFDYNAVLPDDFYHVYLRIVCDDQVTEWQDTRMTFKIKGHAVGIGVTKD